MSNDDEPLYRVRSGKTHPDEEIPEHLHPKAFYLGAAVMGFEFDDQQEWERVGLPGELHPSVALIMKVGLLGDGPSVGLQLTPIMFTVHGAALLVGSLLSSFESLGMGHRLRAELDQVTAGWRDAKPEDLEL